MFAIFTVGTGLGPVLMGLSFDETSSYKFALGVFGVALVCASVLVSRLGRYHFPARVRL
jgi:cyanate permease